VISKKKKFIDSLDELKKLKKLKKFRRSAVCRDFMAVHMKILSARFLKDAFKLETSPSESLKALF
jgi:hypothetical protein